MGALLSADGAVIRAGARRLTGLPASSLPAASLPAEEIGADGYSEDAANCVVVVKNLLGIE